MYFYGTLNAVNGDNTTSGDEPNTQAITLNEDLSSSIGEKSILNARLYPNPCTDILQLQSNSGIDQAIILDINGRQVKQLSPNETNISVSDLTPGVYYLHLRSKGQNETVSFIKR